jgi:exodeoxyribonuclease-5
MIRSSRPYALTVHKSQGSQWNNIVLFDESAVFRDDRARWLYTAVTRAAKTLTVVV